MAVAYAAVGGRLPLADDDAADDDAVTTDATALTRESVRISHLLRRAGFGVSKEEHDCYQSLGLTATIDELVNYEDVDDAATVALADEAFSSGQDGHGAPAWWLARMTNTKRPLQEKMTLFWHGLLTSQMSVVRDPETMIAQNEFFREHAFDSFPAILRGISTNPAMLVYLGTSGSHRRAPNENYPRELMELFSLGEGNFTEQDVREAARAFTGWRLPRNPKGGGASRYKAEPVFLRRRFDNGMKTFFGRSGNFGIDDIIDIMAEQAASAAYITRRLFSFFIYPNPSGADLAPFIAVYNTNERRAGAVVEAMLRSDVFYSPKAYRALVKSPIEYAVSAVKALGLQSTVAQQLATGQQGRRGGGVLGTMSQIPFEPPNVAGWPGGGAWLNSATIFARLNFINRLAAGEPTRGRRRPGVPPLPTLTELETASQALAHFLPLVLDDNVPDEARRILRDYAGGPDANLTPEAQRGLIYLVLASPQFHLS